MPLVPAIVVAILLAQTPPDIRVDARFPGGSVRVESIDSKGRVLAISPGGDLKRGWVCWWYCKVDGLVAGEILSLDVGGGVWATPDRATVSADRTTWVHTPPGKRMGNRIVYTIKAEAATMWFAWGPPFVLHDAEALAKQLTDKHAFVKRVELCKTKEGRSVPALVIEEPGADTDQRRGIWVQARQHAWESGASWVGNGFLEWIVSDDPMARELRRKCTIVVVLIMDVDNVETGNGGKNQHPHDHNRDWFDAPVHPEVQAAIAWIRRMKRFQLFLDLHNPGPGDRQPFFFTPAPELLDAEGRDNLDRFVAGAAREITGPLKLTSKTHASGKGYDPLWERISTNWVRKNLPPGVVAACLETSWNTPASVTANYERVGRELAQATARFFK